MILDMTASYGMQDRVIYSSFNHYSILKVREIDPEAQTAFLYSDGTYDIPGADAVLAIARNRLLLQEAETRGRTYAKWEKPAEDRLIVTADPNMSSMNEVKAYFRMCVKGLRMLQEQYPDHIKVRELSL